jgi:hypothetical protein
MTEQQKPHAERLRLLAEDCHNKQFAMQELHKKTQKGGDAQIAADYAVAKVEYNRARNLLDLEIREQSITIIKPPVHASDCALHNAPALPVAPCDCGAV